MMQRRDLKADLNDGLSATVSPRALASLLPIVASLAHDGIKPQRIFCRCLFLTSSAVMVHIRNEGAMFHEGEKSRSPDKLKYSANLRGFSFSAKRPHISVLTLEGNYYFFFSDNSIIKTAGQRNNAKRSITVQLRIALAIREKSDPLSSDFFVSLLAVFGTFF